MIDNSVEAIAKRYQYLFNKKEKLMTRNEAIKKYKACYSHDALIDFFIEAGMLKVEEEKTVEQKLRDGGYVPESFMKSMDSLGLKIVEK